MSAAHSVPLTQHSWAELESLQARPTPPTLVVIEGPGDLASQAAIWLAESWVPEEDRSADVSVVRPSADKWTVDELDEHVIKPSWFAPSHHRVVIVDGAERMADQTADHLLKTVEEPPSSCTFIFAVRDLEDLTTTLRSRISVAIRLDSLPESEFAKMYEAQGCSAPDAQALARRCGSFTALAQRAIGDPKAAELIVVFDTPLANDSPTTVAVQLNESLEKLAKLGDPFSMASKEQKSDTELRARARTLTRHLIETWRRGLSERLNAATTTEEFRWVALCAESLDNAEVMLDRYVSVRNTLAALLNACYRIPQAQQ